MASTSPTVKVLGRSPLEGAGRTTSGNVSTTKVEVWGQITGTYTTLGDLFTPTDVGLVGSFDTLDLQAVSVSAGTIPTTVTNINAQYDEPQQFIILQTIAEAGTTAAAAESAYVVNFRAIGDSAAAPELT